MSTIENLSIRGFWYWNIIVLYLIGYDLGNRFLGNEPAALLVISYTAVVAITSIEVWTRYTAVAELLALPIGFSTQGGTLAYCSFQFGDLSVFHWWMVLLSGGILISLGVFMMTQVTGDLRHVFDFRRHFGKYPPAISDQQGRRDLAPSVLAEIQKRIRAFRRQSTVTETTSETLGKDHPETLKCVEARKHAKRSMWSAIDTARHCRFAIEIPTRIERLEHLKTLEVC